VVLSADTLVAYDDGELAGKPTSRREARTMIQRFLDTDHRVVTGVALVGPEPGEIETFADTAVVHMGHISEKELENYVQSGSWHGKAGGYNLFDRQDAGWPIQVEGDPTTVVGLPMQRLGEALDRYGVRPNGVPQTPMAQPAAARPHTG